MIVCIQNHWNNTIKNYSGSDREIEETLLADYPHFISVYPEDQGDLSVLLDDIESNQGFSVSVVDTNGLRKSESIDTIAESDVVRHMLGYDEAVYGALSAAKFMSSSADMPLEKFRQALYQYDGDIEKSALFAYGIEPTQEALGALRALLSIQDVTKSEEPLPEANPEVSAAFESGAEAVEIIRRAFQDQLVIKTKLAGKHGKGSFIVKDEDTNKTLLLKPGSGKQSPAAGLEEESASHSQRESAFYYASIVFGLENFLSRTELVFVNGQKYAAMNLLPWSYVTVEHKRKQDPNFSQRLFLPLLQEGILHRWAVMDYVLGNSDRHGQNVMVGPQNDVVLLDHGSTFAGEDFSPGQDKYTFTPFYLRAWSPNNFNSLSTKERAASLPRLANTEAVALAEWIEGVDAHKLAVVLSQYGVNPKPSLARLDGLRSRISGGEPADWAINRLWSGDLTADQGSL